MCSGPGWTSDIARPVLTQIGSVAMGAAPGQIGDATVVASNHLASVSCAGGASDTKLSAVTGGIWDSGNSDRFYQRCCCRPTGCGRRSATARISGRRASDLRPRFSPSLCRPLCRPLCRRRAPVVAPGTVSPVRRAGSPANRHASWISISVPVRPRFSASRCEAHFDRPR